MSELGSWKDVDKTLIHSPTCIFKVTDSGPALCIPYFGEDRWRRDRGAGWRQESQKGEGCGGCLVQIQAMRTAEVKAKDECGREVRSRGGGLRRDGRGAADKFSEDTS